MKQKTSKRQNVQNRSAEGYKSPGEAKHYTHNDNNHNKKVLFPQVNKTNHFINKTG